MLYTIIKGFAIGILVSAPMGPIGVLCIQRTLNRGRWSGFVTGVGASLSDLVYAVLTGLGMSIVVDFVASNQSLLQIIGSFVLVGFGVYLYKQNPMRNIRKQHLGKKNYTQDFLTSFFPDIFQSVDTFLVYRIVCPLEFFCG